MNSSDPAPRIPLWVFYATDFALLAVAAFIAANSPRPLPSNVTLAIVGCAVLGVCVGLVPAIMWLERKKNDALDDRQRALEALAATVSNSAEQVGIATAGLQEIAEIVQKNLRHAEQLPQRLQEKMAEFQSQLANTTDGEKEELEKEVAALRETETERLQTVADRLTKAVAEFGKVESATHQHLSAATEALSKLSLGTAGAIGKAQAAAEQALGHARIEAARHVGDSAGQHLRSLEAAKAAALAELESQIAAAGAAAAGRVAREIATTIAPALAALDAQIVRLESAARSSSPALAASAPAYPDASIPKPPAPAAAASEASRAAAAANADTPPSAPVTDHPAPSASSEVPAPAPRRPRKQRREEAPSSPHAAEPEKNAASGVAAEPPPVLGAQIPEVAPVAPPTTEPFPRHTPPTNDHNGSEVAAAAPVRAEQRPEPRTRATTANGTRPSGAHTADFLDELLPPGKSGAAGVSERVLTSDGATRLVVTAYIGIGNRLFIRGEGPGLSWEKGVPLHFVSIGKWRWETNEATSPVRFKLLKNDEHECAALGAQTVEPGYQQEVTAAF